MQKRIPTWGKADLNWDWVENMSTSGWWWCLCGRSRCSTCGFTRWKGTSSRTTSAQFKMYWPSPARKRWGNISDPRNHSLRKDRFLFNFFIRATSSSKQVKSVQHQALLEVKALIVPRYSRSNDKKSGRYLNNNFFTVQRLYKQWWTEVARRSDPTHRASYLPFNPKGLLLIVSLDMTMISHMFPSSRTWCRTSTTSAVTLANATNSGNKLTSMYPGDNVKVCSYVLCVSKLILLCFPDFFIQLDQECGPLTLHSSLKDLVYYTRRGLRTLSASPSEEAANVAPFFHPPGPSEHDHKSAMKWWDRR